MVGTLLSEGCDSVKFSTCTDQYAPYTVGHISQWGKPTTSNGIDLSPWAGVTGISNSGWYWRVKSTPYGINGAPSAFNFDYYYQMAAGSFIVLAIAYPPTTKFTVQIDFWGTNLPVVPMAASLLDVLSPTENVLPADQQDCSYTDWHEWAYMCNSLMAHICICAWFHTTATTEWTPFDRPASKAILKHMEPKCGIYSMGSDCR